MATLYDYLCQYDYHNDFTGMETINAVNFEDLFDFSPEPVDRLSHDECDFQPSPLAIPPTQAPPNSYSSSSSVNIQASLNTTDRNTADVFADFDAITHGLLGNAGVKGASINITAAANSQSQHLQNQFFHQSQHPDKQSGGEFQLSSSVPVHWRHNREAQSPSNASSSTARSHIEVPTIKTASSSKVDDRSHFAVAASITELLKDLPESLIEGRQRKDDSNRSSLGEEAQQQPVKSKRGRKPGQTNLKTDMKSKLERSRQSARECRARKKLRYQYLDDLILERERANVVLRDELIKYQKWCHELDKGRIPEGLHEIIKRCKEEQAQMKR